MICASTKEILQKFGSLPGTEDPLFRQLWLEGRLQYRDHPQTGDACDELSARLACASLRLRRPLLIEMPDLESRRPAKLFATVLLRYWWDFRHAHGGGTPPPVLYFGSHIGIREHLSQTRIVGMSVDLGALFQEEHVITRGAGAHPAFATPFGDGVHPQLPKVITIYAPADPIAILQTYRPGLVAIDLAEGEKLDWLQPLLRYATEHHIQTIGWGQNPLSRCAAAFSEFGYVFSWPPHLAGPVEVQSLLDPPVHRITPLLVGGSDSDAFSGTLRQAIRLLALASKLPVGRLGEHALAIHWSYVRFLEALHVPMDLYEAEAPRLWGMKSLEGLQGASRRFRETCWPVYPELAAKLEEVAAQLDHAYELIQQADPPLWRLLSNVCITEPPPESVRLLTFTSRARYQLFTYSLLARYNISPDDLRDLRVLVTTPDNIRTIDECYQENEPLKHIALLVGLPGPLAIPKLLPVLLQDEVQVLVYPHQLGPLTRRISDCARKLQPQLSVISELSPAGRVPAKTLSPQSVVVVAEPVVLDPGTAKSRRAERAELRVSDSAEEEVARLFEPEEEVDAGTAEVVGDILAADDSSLARESVWCEQVIEIRFDGGWRAAFAPDARINVIEKGPAGQEAVLRAVAALKLGERVLFIQGQQRQELYDLLIGRVHRHPAFELHLALIKRWQDDFIDVFYRQHQIRTVPELLSRLQSLGSTLVSPLTLRFWLARHTLCPDDPEDLRRLGEVLGLTFIQQHYKRIVKAAVRIRGLHRSLAHRLNHWLQEQVSGAEESAPNDLIDAELGLKFSDFKNSLLVLRVESVAQVTGPFLRSRLGRLERK